jgi:hypothetical protein
MREASYVRLPNEAVGKDAGLNSITFTRPIRAINGKPVTVESHTGDARTEHQTDLMFDELAFKGEVPARATFRDADFTPAAIEH